MKSLFKGVLAAAALAVSAIGFGPAEAQTPPGVLVVGQIAEPKSLDPAAVTAVNDFRILMNVYDGLVRYKDGTLEVEPALAREQELAPHRRHGIVKVHSHASLDQHLGRHQPGRASANDQRRDLHVTAKARSPVPTRPPGRGIAPGRRCAAMARARCAIVGPPARSKFIAVLMSR